MLREERRLAPGRMAPARRRHYVLCYALFAVIIALSVFVIFIIWRPAIDMLVVRYIEKTWAYNAYRNFGYIVMTLFGFVIVMIAEPYLRTGVAKNQLIKREHHRGTRHASPPTIRLHVA